MDLERSKESPEEASCESARARRRWRWLRAAVICVAVLLLAAGFAFWLVTRSWFIIRQVEPELARLLGGEVRIGSARYEGGGCFVFKDLSLVSSELEGEASRIADIGSAVVVVDEGDLLTGSLRLIDVVLRDVLLRPSEDAEKAGVFNFMSLNPKWPGDADAPLQLPPRITIRNVLLEHGTHDGGDYQALGHHRMSGQMSPSPEGDGWFEVELGQIDDPDGGLIEGGLLLMGRWNAATNEFESHLNGLELDEKTRGLCPRVARMWWDLMELEGRVSGLSAQYLADKPFLVVFEIEDVALTMPVDTADVWARYREGQIEPESGRPRMRVSSGTIRLDIDREGISSLRLEDLRGVLGSADESGDLIAVPYSVTLRVPTIPPLPGENRQEWMEEVLSTASFTADFRMDDFRLRVQDDSPPPAVELPLIVAQLMERFALTDWLLSTQVHVQRNDPVFDENDRPIAQPILSNGTATISEAVGSYFKFPYNLSDMKAWVEFDNEKVVIDPLQGVGAGDATVYMTGELESLGMHPSVSLDVKARNIPLDHRLHEALKPNVAAILDALLHQPSYQRLEGAGLIPDAESVAAIETEKQAIRAELNELKQAAGEPQNARPERISLLEDRLRLLQRRADAGPFVLGGEIDLDLHIERAAGKGRPTFTTGRIDLHRIGAIYQRFPYPFWITGGAIALDRDRIRILSEAGNEGVSIVTCMGGAGLITGEVEIVKADDRQQFRPDLAVAVGSDEVNDLLLSAIPLSPQERAAQPEAPAWPGAVLSAGARLLKDLALEGGIDSFGTITADPHGRTDFDIAVGLDHGRIAPTDALARSLGAAGPPWPDGFDVDQIQSLLRVRPREVELVALAGLHDYGGQVMATGRVDFSGDLTETMLDVSVDQLPLGPYLINLLPADRCVRARALWDRFEPAGSLDVRWGLHSVGDHADPPILEVRPQEVSFRLGGQEAVITRSRGEVSVLDGRIHFQDLDLDLQCDGQNDGSLHLEGQYGIAAGGGGDEADAAIQLSGDWQGGRFESPLIPEVLRLLDVDDRAEGYLKYQPRGRLNARFRYISSEQGQPSHYEVAAHPLTLTVNIHDTDLQAELDPMSMLRFTPDLVELVDVSGRVADEPFTLEGAIRPSRGPDVDLTFDFTGDLGGVTARTLLPRAARGVIDAVEFKDGAPTRLTDCWLHLAGKGSSASDEDQVEPELQPGEEESPLDEWQIDFRGRMLNDQASFRAGVTFSEIEGALDVEVHHRPGRSPRVNMDLLFDQVSALGCTFEDASATVLLTDDGTRVLIPDFRASAHGGTVTAEAGAGIGEDRKYRARVGLAGVGLEALLAEVSDEPATEVGLSPEGGDQPSELWASLTMSGLRDEPDSRVGRGAIRVMGGQVARIPVAMRLVQVLHLTAPMGDGLDYAQADFYLDGGRLVFEDMLFESTVFDSIAALQLRGRGELDLDTLQLDTRFTSRGGLLLVRDVVGGIGDQLYVIEVSGPVDDPKASVVPLPGFNP